MAAVMVPVQVCVVCGARPEAVWRWCPDCGGELRDVTAAGGEPEPDTIRVVG
jgi:hypothetical protein